MPCANSFYQLYDEEFQLGRGIFAPFHHLIGGFFTSLAAMDTASTFGGMGSSRARVVSFLAEPVVILVLFTVALIAQATIPFVVNHAGGRCQ